jgi:hypothetical protein
MLLLGFVPGIALQYLDEPAAQSASIIEGEG